MHLQTFIFNYGSRFFRFKEEGLKLICDICYWRGEIIQVEAGKWSAEIKQKYDPFEHYKSEALLQSKDEAMRWVASRLIKIGN